MSELKRRHINEVMDMFCLTKGDLNWSQVYYADDADKVIAEKDKELRRQKYKRCLDKAELCKARYDEEDAKVNGSGASWEYISKEMKYWERWRLRWEAFAEKFNETK